MIYKSQNVISVIVVYNFKVSALRKTINSHLKNFKKILIINNSPDISLKDFRSDKIFLITNASNLGLAKALNIAIKKIMTLDFSMIAFFDQDSILPANFTKRMLIQINKIDYNNVALFSPAFYNILTNSFGDNINFKPFRLIRTPRNKYPSVTYPEYVITSGSFIPISSFNSIGIMHEPLFIDFIDIEWCLRARLKGYEVVSFQSVYIKHKLGDYAINILGIKYPIHSPTRMYYYFRNSIYLYSRKDLPINWRIIDATRNIFRFLFYIMFVKNRLIYLKYIIKGYYHGFIKKMGKLEE